MSDEKFNSINCCQCGIAFGFGKEVETLWRRDEKTFFCPNGHPQVWTKPKESEEQKELKKLRTKVEELQGKLDAALKDAADQKKRADELATELEIWRPSTAETKDGSEQTGSGDRAGQ